MATTLPNTESNLSIVGEDEEVSQAGLPVHMRTFNSKLPVVGAEGSNDDSLELPDDAPFPDTGNDAGSNGNNSGPEAAAEETQDEEPFSLPKTLDLEDPEPEPDPEGEGHTWI